MVRQELKALSKHHSITASHHPDEKNITMKPSIFITSALTTGAFAWPKPQLLDLNLGAKVTVFSTVTVTKPAAVCLPAPATVAPVSLPSLKPSVSIPGVPPTSIPAPAQPTTTSKWIPPPSTTPKSVPIVQTSWVPSPSLPAVVQSSPWPQPTPQVPSTIGRVTGTAQAYLSAGLTYQAAILYHHNAARLNHGAAPLVWDASCAANALLAAQTCNYARYLPAGVSQGQNLYLSTSAAFNVTAAITETWYKNELSSLTPWFGIASLPVTVLPSVSAAAQVVWKGTTRVGCASVDCSGKMKVNGVASGLTKYTVCNYAAAGNVAGLFALNVGKPASTTYLGKWTD
ncbi:hypothetical protein E8E12_001393 [Didymella heteroderae]|uniref:SCP domain-containing protein n=1 Tax=Didymella heteroderae TaxID=1769908 RepID=A0A9P4WNU8_9PLEO|nr:hypothetical protein E8E12_001393 [Didymella heteroderae]